MSPEKKEELPLYEELLKRLEIVCDEARVSLRELDIERYKSLVQHSIWLCLGLKDENIPPDKLYLVKAKLIEIHARELTDEINLGLNPRVNDAIQLLLDQLKITQLQP